MNNIAIILARSGSKGVKDKNIKPLNGKPLMAYSIEAAAKSGCFSEICVSTDSQKYAEIAKQYGASVPFLRSAKNSSDQASSNDAIQEVLRGYAAMGKRFEYCMLLQPTSPFRTANDIINAFKLLNEKQAQSVVSVCELEHPLQWCFELSANNSMEPYARAMPKGSRRQDLKKHYRFNGAIYLFKAEIFDNEQPNIYNEHCFAYIMSRKSSVDIDSNEDFEYAEFLCRAAQKSGQKP